MRCSVWQISCNVQYGRTHCMLHGIITWPSPKAGQVLKCRRFFIFWGVEMVIGWICSRDLFETSWEGLHEVLPIVIAEESRMFTCVLSLPQWRCYRNFEPPVSHTNVHAGCGRSWRAFLKWFLVEMILTTMYTLRPSIPWHNASFVRSYYAVLVHGLQRFPPTPQHLQFCLGGWLELHPQG